MATPSSVCPTQASSRLVPDRPEWFKPPLIDPEEKQARRLRAKQLKKQHRHLVQQSQLLQHQFQQAEELRLGDQQQSPEHYDSEGAAHGSACAAQATAVSAAQAAADIHRMKSGGLTFYMLHLCQIDTFEQWCATRCARDIEKEDVNVLCKNPNIPGAEKMSRGKSSNTGCLAPLTLPGQSELWLKGFKEHDDALDRLFHDTTTTTAILWPGEQAVLPSELLQIAHERTGGRLAVVAVDASWDGAMRMRGSYPPNIVQVKLGPESVLGDRGISLLGPVRRYRGDLEQNGRVSTLEAIAALLYELHGDEELMEGMLNNLKIKVDAMLVQKLRKPCYGTVAAALEEESRQAGMARAEQYLTSGLSVKEVQGLEEMMRQVIMTGE